MNNIHQARTLKSHPTSFAEIVSSSFKMLRLNLWIVVVAAVILSILSGFYASTRSTTYKATTALLVDPRLNSGLRESQSSNLVFADSLLVDSEMEVLSSERLIRRVAEALLARVEAPSSSTDAQTDEAQTDREKALQVRMKWLRDGLTVVRQGKTFVILVTFETTNGDTAALVANTVADEYLAMQADEKLGRVSKTTEWLDDELARLSEEITQKKTASQQFMVDNAIPVDESKGIANRALLQVETEQLRLQSEQRRLQIDMQSILSDIERLRVTESFPELVSVALPDARLDNLLDQFYSAFARARDDGAQGSSLLVQQIKDLIEEELSRLEKNRAAQLEVIQANLSRLDFEHRNLTAETIAQAKARSALEAMQLNIRTLEQQHQAMAAQFQRSAGEDRFVAVSTRIIDRAIAPARGQESNILRFAIAGLVGGAILGTGIVFLVSQIDDRIRDPQQVIETLGLNYVGAVPIIRNRNHSVVPTNLLPGDTNAPSKFMKSLLVMFGGARQGPNLLEWSLRRAKLTLEKSASPKSIVVSSPQAGDGKTVFSTNLATFLGDRGHNVLIVDVDPYKRGLSRLLLSQNEADSTQETLKLQKIEDNIDALLITGNGRRNELSQLLEIIAEEIKSMPTQPDVIIFDAAPLMTGVEEVCKRLNVTDLFCLLRYGHISESRFLRLLQQRGEIARLISGVFITQIPDRHLPYFEFVPGYGYVD